MREFDLEYIDAELDALSDRLGRTITLHVIGGGAMAWRDQKAGTKDLDVILGTDGDADALLYALSDRGYDDPDDLEERYDRMEARRVVENDDGFRWDVFVQRVLGFEFSDRMRGRAEPWRDAGKLRVLAASPEDLFAFKALTDRDRDRDDMAVLWRDGIDPAVVRSEVVAQAENPAGKRFAAFFYEGLLEFVELTGATFPDMDLYEGLHAREMVAEVVALRLNDAPLSIAGLADELDLPEQRVRDACDRLVRQGLATVHGDTVRPGPGT